MDKYITFIKAHEKMALIIGVLLVCLFLGNKFVNYEAEKDKLAANSANLILQQQIDANKQNAVQVTQLLGQYSVIASAVARQNALTASAINNRNQSLKTQINANSSLSLVELAQRWKNLANVPDSDILVNNNAISLTDAGSRATVNQLEQVPVLTANLKDTQGIVANKDLQINQANTLIDGYKNQVTGLSTQIADKDKACKADIDSVKSAARKSKRNWFIAGFISGIATRLALKF